ncbi:hypothetical protein [Oceanicoccus sp. KOV_DT_Chl]|uniref:hypothetical protein n=1 Tax=Oceanicoccus sp. KOV_DT_Chl TaxID=1904639 RepID=UPI0011AF6DC5|nr:hypothetical protein [Oceanicoccus sp. KOV_DT_Chl]
MLSKILIITMFFVFSGRAGAEIFLPDSLCDNPYDCQAATTIFSSDNVAIFSSPSQYIWAGYNLGGASNYYDTGSEPSYSEPETTSSISGTLWIKSKAIYYNEPIIIEVFAPNPYPWDAAEYLNPVFTLNAEALLTGTGMGSRLYSDDILIPPGSDNMTVAPFAPSCVECGEIMELNLLYLLYREVSPDVYAFELNSLDNRTVIYTQEDYFYTSQHLGTATYSLANVPLPTATWLFFSALIGLVGINRRK